MTELITQAPIQVRPDTAHKHERIFPLLVAEAKNRLIEYSTGQEKPRVDVWNTIGYKFEKDFLSNQAQGIRQTRAEFVSDQIGERYKILHSQYGIDSRSRLILRDDDKDFVAVVQREVARMVQGGLIKPIEETFHACPVCNIVIAPMHAPVGSCPSCKGSQLETTRTVGLFLMIGDATKQWLRDAIRVFPMSAKGQLKSNIDSLPAGAQISKDRKFGIDLSAYGIDERFKLDPKIALGMTHIVLRELGVGDVDEYMVGRNAIMNFAPYVQIADPESKIMYTSLGLIPEYSSKEVKEHGSGAYLPFIALAILGSNSDLSVEQQQALLNEREKFLRKLESSLKAITLLGNEGEIEPMFDELKDGNISHSSPRSSMLELRARLFKDVSRKGIPHMMERGTHPSERYVQQLIEISRLLYGN